MTEQRALIIAAYVLVAVAAASLAWTIYDSVRSSQLTERILDTATPPPAGSNLMTFPGVAEPTPEVTP